MTKKWILNLLLYQAKFKNFKGLRLPELCIKGHNFVPKEGFIQS